MMVPPAPTSTEFRGGEFPDALTCPTNLARVRLGVMRLRRPGPAVMIFVITAAICLASPVRGLTDSRYTPLVGEALLRHGSFVLDQWFLGRTNLSYQLERIGSHVYHRYPPGGPVLATPLVWVLARMGLSA